MAKKENLIERMDNVKADSVSNKEFEETWGISIDAQVKKMMDKWNVLLTRAKDDIDNRDLPDGERLPMAADLDVDYADEAVNMKNNAPCGKK